MSHLKDKEILNLKKTIAYLEKIIALTPGNVYWKNRYGIYLGCNENQAKLLGLKTPKDIIGKYIHDLMETTEANKIAEIDEMVMAGGVETMFEEVVKDMNGNRTIYLTRKVPLFDEAFKVEGLIGISFDITERKKAEENLINEKKIYQDAKNLADIYIKNILDNLPEHFFWMDRDGRVLGCNQKQAKSFGFDDASQLIGKNAYDLSKLLGWKDERIAEGIRQNDLEIMQTRKQRIVEEKLILNGKEHTYLSYKNPLIDQNDEVIGVFGVAIDITERKQMEEALLRAKQKAELSNKAKSEFILNMSHDIRTPFSGILGIAKILEKKESDPKKRELLGHLLESSEQVLEFLNEILELSDIEQNKKQDIIKFNIYDLFKSISKLISSQIKHKKLEYKVSISKDLPEYLIGDKKRLHRILVNLIGNAIKYTKKGYVSLTVNVTFQSKKEIRLIIEVKDSGIGIPKDKFDVIFERFSRLSAAYEGNYEGKGLGLYIVKQYIHMLDGEIKVQSEPGKGSTFTCELPFEVSHAFPQLDSSKNTDQAQNLFSNLEKPDLKVLIVEDNFIAQKMAKIMLQDFFKIEADCVLSGKEALDLISNNSYDLILLDIGLPDIDGFQLAKKIRQLSIEQAKIIGLTAHLDKNFEHHPDTIHFDDIWIKPLTVEKMINFLLSIC